MPVKHACTTVGFRTLWPAVISTSCLMSLSQAYACHTDTQYCHKLPACQYASGSDHALHKHDRRHRAIAMYATERQLVACACQHAQLYAAWTHCCSPPSWCMYTHTDSMNKGEIHGGTTQQSSLLPARQQRLHCKGCIAAANEDDARIGIVETVNREAITQAQCNK